MPRKFPHGSFLAALLLTMVGASADVTFTGAGGDLNWFNPKNWDQGQVPKVDDNAIITSAQPANAVVIDNSTDPATKDKIAFASRLMIGDGTTASLTVKSRVSLADSLRVGNSDFNHSGSGTVTQVSGTVDPGSSPQIGTTSGMTGAYNLQGGIFSVGDTSITIGGNTEAGQTAGTGSFVISGGKFLVGSRVIFGNAGTASFTVIGSQATSIDIGDQFNQDGAGLVNLNLQIDKAGLTPITTAIFFLQGITLYPSFAQGIAPYAGTWTVVNYTNLGGNTDIPVLGKSVDPAHWTARLDTINDKLTVTYKP